MAKRTLKKHELKQKHLFEAYENASELPKRVRIEASSKCQLDCVECYMRTDPEGVANGCQLGNLKFKDFKKFVDENDIESVEISNHGEIFLNPELDKIIKYAYEKGIELNAGNGVNLNYLPKGMAVSPYTFFSPLSNTPFLLTSRTLSSRVSQYFSFAPSI